MTLSARILAGLFVVVLSGRAVEAQTLRADQVSSPKLIRAIVIQLQAAIRDDQPRKIATLILFPMEIIKAPLGVTRVPSVPVFMKVYPSVFTKRLREAILRQNPDSIVVHDGAATVANGKVVIGYRCATADPGSCETGVTQIRPYKN